MQPPKKQRPAGKGGPSKSPKSSGEFVDTPTYGTAESVSRVAIGSLEIGAVEDLGGEVWAARGLAGTKLGFHHSYADAYGAVWRAYLRGFTGTPDTSDRTH
jgi:hypothetical protein